MRSRVRTARSGAVVEREVAGDQHLVAKPFIWLIGRNGHWRNAEAFCQADEAGRFSISQFRVKPCSVRSVRSPIFDSTDSAARDVMCSKKGVI